MQAKYYKFASLRSVRPIRPGPMPTRAKKASTQPETGASEPATEPAEAPATKVPEGTAGQGGDGDLDDDSASPAASSAAKQPPVDDGSAKEPEADAAAALAAPTQTMEAAGILDGSPDKVVNTQSDMSDDGEEASE